MRGIALQIACEIHPLNNLRVLQYLKGTLGVDRCAEGRLVSSTGSTSASRRSSASLSRDPATGTFCHGESATLADVCLVPQMANARRMAIDLAPYPTLMRIDAAARALPAFAAAAPEKQPDARLGTRD